MKRRLEPTLLVLGALGGMLLLGLMLPLVNLFVQADWPRWLAALRQPSAREALLTSVGASTISVLIMSLFGVPLGYLLAKGELPHAQPARPQDVERNIVVTLRDWMNEKQYLHDLIASDRRHPTVNAYGPLYGSPEYSSMPFWSKNSRVVSVRSSTVLPEKYFERLTRS